MYRAMCTQSICHTQRTYAARSCCQVRERSLSLKKSVVVNDWSRASPLLPTYSHTLVFLVLCAGDGYSGYNCTLTEESYSIDPVTSSPTATPNFLGSPFPFPSECHFVFSLLVIASCNRLFRYSGSGIAEAEVVYVNYGREEDFLLLESFNISVAGDVFLERFSLTLLSFISQARSC